MYEFDRTKIIEGEKVYLRPIKEEDTEMVLAWRNADFVIKNFYYRKPISKEEHLNWLRTKVYPGLVHQFVVVLKDGDVPVGSVYLQHFDEKTSEAEDGIFLSENAPKGQGIGTEAMKLLNLEYGFKTLKLHSIVAKIFASNAASRRLHEKAGLSEYEFIKDDAVIDGEHIDTVMYRMVNPVK